MNFAAQSFSLSGVVLAAGRSTRMGADKAMLMVDRAPLWERQYTLLLSAGVNAGCALSIRPDQTWVPPDLPRVIDEIPDQGPLGGIATSLDRSQGEWLAVLAVDLPRIPVEWFKSLVVDLSPEVGAVGQQANGLFEPLAAVYPKVLLPLLKQSLAEKKLSLQRIVKHAVAEGRLRVRPIQADQACWFENWNTPDEITSQ